MDDTKQVGVLLAIAIAVIVALTFLPLIATNTAIMTNTYTTPTNETITLPSTATGRVTLTGIEILSLAMTNATSGVVITNDNYTLYNHVLLTDGTEGAQIGNKQKASVWNGTSVNVTYTYKPSGYVDEAGGRAVAGIIVLLAALGIALVALPQFREAVLDVF